MIKEIKNKINRLALIFSQIVLSNWPFFTQILQQKRIPTGYTIQNDPSSQDVSNKGLVKLEKKNADF